jgi:hypothetical protein
LQVVPDLLMVAALVSLPALAQVDLSGMCVTQYHEDQPLKEMQQLSHDAQILAVSFCACRSPMPARLAFASSSRSEASTVFRHYR